ncbi:MAG: GNAT family N-acetyltransferase [Bacteriovorax sp.]|nr:GNAT family N-acetyltransferase [Bacteriovorax sp.]
MEITTKWKELEFDKIIQLFDAVGWSAYTQNPAELKTAFENSSYVLIGKVNSEVVAALRSLSDNVSIHHLQDILISPAYQGKGFGKQMLNMALEHYAHVRTHLLLTDDEEKQHKFYKSLGYQNVKEVTSPHLNSFVKFKQS